MHTDWEFSKGLHIPSVRMFTMTGVMQCNATHSHSHSQFQYHHPLQSAVNRKCHGVCSSSNFMLNVPFHCICIYVSVYLCICALHLHLHCQLGQSAPHSALSLAYDARRPCLIFQVATLIPCSPIPPFCYISLEIGIWNANSVPIDIASSRRYIHTYRSSTRIHVHLGVFFRVRY